MCSTISEVPLTEDCVLGGTVRLMQPEKGNRAGHDAVLLAAAVPAAKGETISDFGAGSGVAGLCAAVRCGAGRLVAVDIDPAMTDLAARNMALNSVAGTALTVDLTAPGKARAAAGLMPDQADHVMANPPYLDPSASRLPPDERRALAFAAEPEDLELWVKAACGHVRAGGTVTFIHRADALARLVEAMAPRLGALAVLPVHPRACAHATRILVQGVKGSGAPLRLLPPLILHQADGSAHTDRAQAVLTGEGGLNL